MKKLVNMINWKGAKDRNEQILVAFQGEEDDTIVRQDFDNFMSSQYKLLEEETKLDQENKIF